MLVVRHGTAKDSGKSLNPAVDIGQIEVGRLHSKAALK